MVNKTPIKRFAGEFSFLSNMYRIEPITIGSLTFISSENFYVAMKFMDQSKRIHVTTLAPKVAKNWANNKKKADERNIRADWLNVRLGVMEFILRHKFNSKKLRELLLGTGDRELIEGNYWNDTFWGVDLKDKEEPGYNHLGRLIMSLREELIANPDVDLVSNYHSVSKRPIIGKIIVVNRRKEREDVYVGRNSGLGNPYAVHNGDYTNEDSMRMFDDYFKKHVLGTPSSKGYPIAKKIMLWIKNGYDVKLGCFCKKHCYGTSAYDEDKTICHADFIKNTLEIEIEKNY
jgi:ribA/ribD-fused uncharacterized protein